MAAICLLSLHQLRPSLASDSTPPHIWEIISTLYLIAEDTDAAGAANLIRSKPHRRQTSWNGQDEGLADRHQALTKEGDPESVGRYTEHLYPGTKGRPERPEDHGVPEALKPSQLPFHSRATIIKMMIIKIIKMRPASPRLSR